MNSRDSEAIFMAMSSAADTDEWSAALVSAGLVQALVRSLRACLEIRSILRLAVETVESGDDTPPSRSASMRSVADIMDGTESGCCLGCSLEVVQVEVMLAIGGLLSAHPLAARDRFLLADGSLVLTRIVSAPPCDRDTEHGCLLGGGVDTEGVATAAAIVAPLLHEHCCLVAVQVVRLCLGAGAPGPLPAEIVEGASRLVEALSHAMRALCENNFRGDCRGTDSFFPADFLRRGRAELERGASGRPSARSREFVPLHCPSEVDPYRSGDGEAWAVEAETCAADTSSTPQDSSGGGKTHGPSISRSYLLCR